MKSFAAKNWKSGTTLLVATALAGLLTACGGGGGSSDASSQAPVVAQSTIVTTPPASSGYTPGSEDDQAFNLINSERNTCGFGYLNHNATLDAAAQAYVNYVVQNNATPNHVETSGLPGFTGANYWERITAAGYTWAGVPYEVGVATPSGTMTGPGQSMVHSLLSAPYHMVGLLSPTLDVGLTVATGGAPGSGAQIIGSSADVLSTYLWIDLATSTTEQEPSSTDVLTYPCQGTTNTKYQLAGEDPNPIPSRNLATSPVGQPILVKVRDGNTLAITSLTVNQVSNGQPVQMLPVVTSANDPNNLLTANIAFDLPNQPLLPNTLYSVSVTGTNSGAPFTKTFTFTTGNVL